MSNDPNNFNKVPPHAPLNTSAKVDPPATPPETPKPIYSDPDTQGHNIFTRKPWSLLKQEIGQWAQHNFDHNESKHPLFQMTSFQPPILKRGIPLRSLAPLLGMYEEYGELQLAILQQDAEEIKDALADIGVYLCDFCYREGLSINSIHPNGDPISRSLPIQLGKLSHAVLKRHQGIRDMHLHYTSKAEDAIAKITFSLECLAREYPLFPPYLDILNEVWEKVKIRDWKKYPGSGLPISPKEVSGG